jgi:carbamoyl-phosphate synthase large subunit
MGKVSPSGVTGVTGGGETVRDKTLDDISLRAIQAIDPSPHGLYGVDLTFDSKGIPNPTEINIGRFFTTHHFFTEAGLNMPLLYVMTALGKPVPFPKRIINPLPAGLIWIRGMDFHPVLTTRKAVDAITKSMK